MPELDELKIRLRSLQKSPIYAKPAAAEEALECAVRVLAEFDIKMEALIESLSLEQTNRYLEELDRLRGGD